MTLYAVVRADGTVKCRKGSAVMVYATRAAAQRLARFEGEAVCALELDLTREPVFIRTRTVAP